MEDGAGARKRKRDGGEGVASVVTAAGVFVEAGLGCFSWKELSLGEKEEEHEGGVTEESVEEVMRQRGELRPVLLRRRVHGHGLH